MSKIKTFIKSCIGFHCQIPFVYLSGVTSHAVHIGVSGQYPPGQYPPPPGQYPPRTKSPRMISLVKHVLVKEFFFNSSVLNYPKTSVGKIYIYFFFNSSVLNYPKLCASEKRNRIFSKIAVFQIIRIFFFKNYYFKLS